MDYQYSKFDKEAAVVLNNFLPNRIFDAHAHLYRRDFMSDACVEGSVLAAHEERSFADYLSDMQPLFGAKRQINMNIITYPDPSFSDSPENRKKAVDYLVHELNGHYGNVGEIVVLPEDTEDDIQSQLIHPDICGLKCYHFYANCPVTWEAKISEYLPESAWEVANRRQLCITLHMVRDSALSDSGNLQYIKTMAKKYPCAKLILAHAARSFATWTAVESVSQLRSYENVFFDFSAVCESSAMFQIMKKVGVSRCVWGSDYPICCMSGKAISLADGFYWINSEDLERFFKEKPVHAWLVGTENLMAVRQACIMAELNDDALEALFFKNALNLFNIKSAKKG